VNIARLIQASSRGVNQAAPTEEGHEGAGGRQGSLGEDAVSMGTGQ